MERMERHDPPLQLVRITEDAPRGNYEPAWNRDRPRQAYQLALLGATDMQMAAVMGVTDRTIRYWKEKYPEFERAVLEGKDVADAEVAKSLYHMACGYERREMHISEYRGRVIKTPVTRYYPPVAAAAIRWLSARHPERWSEISKTEVTSNINIKKLDLSKFTLEEMKMLRDIGFKQIAQNAQRN